MKKIVKRLIDGAYGGLKRAGGSHLCDAFSDHTVKVLAVFGLCVAYAITPDGNIHLKKASAKDLGEARQVAWSLHESEIIKWMKHATSADLLDCRDRELNSRAPNIFLVKMIQGELDDRVGPGLKKVLALAA